MTNQNQANVDHVIGTNNYDVGHVLSLTPGGLATITSACNPAWKAQGVSGTRTPLGYLLESTIDHELGHQFGATHVQNNDFNRFDPSAVEPGSGSTIMSYAGVSWPDVQERRDPYFNGLNLAQIGYDFIDNNTDTCAVKTPIPAAPVVTNPTDIIIPAKTPFALTAKASGAGSVSPVFEKPAGTSKSPAGTKTGDKYASGGPGRPGPP